ncbi:hypothetical protein [Planococcus lenghuensis]|nr:hypothetical protein [Planococcus lenghuensis]
MRNDRNSREKSKINNEDDSYSRTFLGTPTIGGAVVIAVIVLYFIFK